MPSTPSAVASSISPAAFIRQCRLYLALLPPRRCGRTYTGAGGSVDRTLKGSFRGLETSLASSAFRVLSPPSVCSPHLIRSAGWVWFGSVRSVERRSALSQIAATPSSSTRRSTRLTMR